MVNPLGVMNWFFWAVLGKRRKDVRKKRGKGKSDLPHGEKCFERLGWQRAKISDLHNSLCYCKLNSLICTKMCEIQLELVYLTLTLSIASRVQFCIYWSNTTFYCFSSKNNPNMSQYRLQNKTWKQPFLLKKILHSAFMKLITLNFVQWNSNKTLTGTAYPMAVTSSLKVFWPHWIERTPRQRCDDWQRTPLVELIGQDETLGVCRRGVLSLIFQKIPQVHGGEDAAISRVADKHGVKLRPT